MPPVYRSPFWLSIAIAALAVGCEKKSERPTVVDEGQLGSNLCNIAPPASLGSDNSIGGQLGLDLAKTAKLPISGNVGATINDKVTALFQAVPEGDAVCQLLLQSITCATAMKNEAVASAMSAQVADKCQVQKRLNSPERAQILERINVLKYEIDSATKQIERLSPETQAKGKAWQDAKLEAERDASPSEEVAAKLRLLEETYWAAFRTEDWFRTEKHKRELEVASLAAKVQ